MKKYLVVLEEPCPECRGTGVALHPDWAWLHRELGPNFSLEEAAERLGLPSPDLLPPEEVRCPGCEGTGRARREVPLEEALAELGISRTVGGKDGA